MPNIPTQVVDFSVYNQNNKLLGHGDEVTLPSVVSKTATASLAGGDIDVPGMMTENMELEVPFNVFDREAGNCITLTRPATLIFRGAEQKVDTGNHGFNYQGLKVTTKGITKEVDIGTLKRGDKMDSKIKLTLTYIKIEDNTGYNILELDKLNGTFIVNGEDVRGGIAQYL